MNLQNLPKTTRINRWITKCPMKRWSAFLLRLEIEKKNQQLNQNQNHNWNHTYSRDGMVCDIVFGWSSVDDGGVVDYERHQFEN